jgi:predicted ATPase/DNA-binding SARP family transcriptional activator
VWATAADGAVAHTHASRPDLEDQVEGGRRDPTEPREAGLFGDRADGVLTGLGAERVAARLRHPVRHAEEGGPRVVQAADGVEVVLDGVAGEWFDDQPRPVRGQRLTHVPCSGHGVAHVVQRVERRHEVVPGPGEVLRGRDLEADPVGHTRLGGPLPSQLDGVGVVVGADDDRVRVGLGDQDCRGPQPAPDVGDLGAGGQLRVHTVEGRDPVRHELGDVPGSVEGVDADEHVLVMVVPRDACARAEGLGQARLGAQVPEDGQEGRRDVGSVGVGEAERLLLGQRERAGGRVVVDVATGGLAAQPLGEVARVAAGAVGELLGCRRALGERAVQPEPVTDHHLTGGAGRAEIGDELPEELGELVVVHHCCSQWKGRPAVADQLSEPGGARWLVADSHCQRADAVADCSGFSPNHGGRRCTMAGDHAPPALRVEVLGPLRLIVDGVEVAVRGPKRRAVLALLALADGRSVSVEGLLDALWPDELPESGRQAIQTHVSRLRGHLGAVADRLLTLDHGYRLDLGVEGLDLRQARDLLAKARAQLPVDTASALALLREAHALWRGPVLADLADLPAVATAVEACAHLHREVTDALVTAAVDAGEADGVVGLAAATVAADPLREPAVLLLMRALAAAGEAPEALRVGREFRQHLAEETGLDPSPALSELERRIAAGSIAPSRTRAPQTRTPEPSTPLLGRDPEVAALHRLLAAERLVTLAGPGGVGKTRVALEVAQGSQAATVVLLAPVSDPAAIPYALATALDLEVAQGDVLAACIAVLGARPSLLVIDNCEHLLAAVRDVVGELLASCPGLSVLTTSREPLGLAAEYTSRLGPLPLPTASDDLRRTPAVALFLDRARRVRSEATTSDAELETIADIVRRLDGMPLAIELAAGRLSTFSLEDLYRRLDRALDLLAGSRSGGDTRHRTLRATIEWSYDLLPEDEQRLLRHLAVFPDGLDLDAAEALAVAVGVNRDAGAVLARLVDASMLQPSFGTRTRYRMLQVLQDFGRDRLATSGEADAATDRLIRWAVDLTAWIGGALSGDRETEADATLRRELPNLRVAWRSVRDRDRFDDAAQIIAGLFDAIAYRDLIEIRAWAEELVDAPAVSTHPRAAEVLGSAAEAAYHRGDHQRAAQLAMNGLERASGGRGELLCLLTLSVSELARGAYAEAAEHALAAARLEPGCEGQGIAALARLYAGDVDGARELSDADRERGESPTMRAWRAYVAAEVASAAADLSGAEREYTRALALARTSGATFLVGVATVGLLAVQARTGQVHDVLRGYREVIDYFARTGNWTHQWATLRDLAGLLRRLDDHPPADAIEAAADGAPEAPAGRGVDAQSASSVGTAVSTSDRGAVLAIARQAIARHLAVSAADERRRT